MRRILAVLLCTLGVVISFTGCGNAGNMGNDGSSTESGGSNVSGSNTGNDGKTSGKSDKSDTSGVEADYANLSASEGLDIVSNGDGTCTIVGIGICKDKDIVIPTQSSSGDKVTKIDEKAFYNAKTFNAVYFLGNNIEVDEKAFQSCKVEKVVISGSEVTFDENVFMYDDGITEVHIANSKVTFGAYAFYEAGDDMSVVFSSSEIKLDKKAFQSSDVKTINISGGTIDMGENAFCYCDDISTVEVKGTTVSIDEYAFYDSGKNMAVTFTDCALTLDDKAFQSSGSKTLSIENSTTEMGEYAFEYCEKLESVTIGKGSTSIDSYSFYDCTSLVNVSIGGNQDSDDNVIVIGDKAFQSCGVESLTIAGKNVEIGKGAFAYCENLSSVTIGDGSLKVKDNAFYDCSKNLVITYAGSTYSADGITKIK